MPSQMWPDRIATEEQLDHQLTSPGAALVDSIKTLSSPLIVLGAGGKMGPSLAVLARRAAQTANYPLEIIAVSRFNDAGARAWLEKHGVKTVACDLLDKTAIQKLPDAENVIYMVGMKFGSTQTPSMTWAINTLVPCRVAECYPRARLVALSTGNVYPMSEIPRGGSTEGDVLTPLGEYANSTVGRERIFEFYSRTQHTPTALMRLFYAVDLRYGVPVDIARKVAANEPVDVTNGYFNCIWQGDANDMILRALALASSPPTVWNLCRPEVFSVRAVAEKFGELLGCKARIINAENATALLGNSAQLCAKLGPPSVSMDLLMRWIAHWVQHGGRSLNKPTHFEVRDGKY